MIPIFEPLILNSHYTKWIVRKNVWKLNLETITMTIMFCHSYVLDVQILSSNKVKTSSPIWLIADVWVVFINSVHYIISIVLCTLLFDNIKNEISLYYPIDNGNGNKKVGLIRAYFVYSFYNVKKDEKIHLKNGDPLKVKRGSYTMKDMEKVSSGKVKYDSLTGKSVIDPTITRFGPYMNKILGISNGNYIDMLLSKKMFSFKINKLSANDNILNGKPCNILHTGYLNKDISFGDIVYFEPKNVQYKKLVIGTIDQLKVSLVNGDGNEIFSNFKISIVLHIVKFFLKYIIYHGSRR